MQSRDARDGGIYACRALGLGETATESECACPTLAPVLPLARWHRTS